MRSACRAARRKSRAPVGLFFLAKSRASPPYDTWLHPIQAQEPLGSGLNLSAASYFVLFDPWWNPAVEAHAIDRTHRIGQKQTVFAYRLIIKGTIEEKIRLL